MIASFHTLFVYGTLKRYGKWNHLLKHSKLIASNEAIFGKIFLSEHLYPVLFSGKDKIEGEVYRVPEQDYVKVIDLEKDYNVEVIQTIKGEKVEVFFSKDNDDKKNLKRIKKFDAKKYFELWLQKTPKNSDEYKHWQDSNMKAKSGEII